MVVFFPSGDQLILIHICTFLEINEYKKHYYLNFEQDSMLSTLFDSSLNPDRIINNLSLYIGEKIESDNSFPVGKVNFLSLFPFPGSHP